MNTEIRDMLESYKRLYRELDAVGGPGNNGELFETIISMEEDILGALDLPPAQMYRKILWGASVEDVLSGLDEARDEYEHRPIRDTALFLADAALKQIDEPENILPMAGFSHHTYQIFLYREKLLRAFNPAEIDDIICEMARAEERLSDIGLLEFEGIKAHRDLYHALREEGLDSLDEFLMNEGTFDLDDEDMDARQLYLRGLRSGMAGKYDEAIRDLTAAIRQRNDIASIFYNRGFAWDSINEPGRALEDYTRAIEIDPEHYLALCNRGLIRAMCDMHTEALEDFNAAIEARPGLFNAYCNRGNLLSELGDHRRAAEDFTMAIALKPDEGFLYCNRGISYHQLGWTDMALEDLNKSADMGCENAKRFLNDFYQTEHTDH